jgi:hypothetical protein
VPIGWPQNRFRHCGEQKNLWLLPWTELDRPVRSLVAISTELTGIKLGKRLSNKTQYKTNAELSPTIRYFIMHNYIVSVSIVPGWWYLLGMTQPLNRSHTFYSPTTVGVTIALLQTQELSNSRRLSLFVAS